MYTDANLKGQSCMLPPDAALDAKLAEATNAEQIRQITKSHLAAQGTIIRTRDDLGMQIVGGQQQKSDAGVPLSASGYKFERVVRFAESTGRRALVIRANTLEDLLALERQVTGETA